MTRLKIALLVLFLALAGVIGWQATKPSDEPVYNGKKLTQWLEDYQNFYSSGEFITHPTSPQFQAAQESVFQIGTNAIPTLLRLVRANDSAFKKSLMGLLARQHFFKVDYKPAEYWNKLGMNGFQLLGTNALPALPDLIEIVTQDISPSSQFDAVFSFAGLGPQAKQAAPYLLHIATNSGGGSRPWIGDGLYSVDPEAARKAGITPKLIRN